MSTVLSTWSSGHIGSLRQRHLIPRLSRQPIVKWTRRSLEMEMSTFFTTTTTTSLFLRRTMNERREIEWWPHFKLHRALLFPLLPLSSDILFLQHDNSTLRQCMRFSEEASQFSVGQIAQSLTCSIMEKPHSGLDLEVKPAKVWANFYSVLAVTH